MVNVSFKYAHPIIDCGENDKSIKDEQSILNNINLDLTKGTVTAIVGQSGSGKSTIAQILLKYYNLSHGSILVNNRNIISINSSDYRKKVGYVGQQPVLFSMTIKQNIKLANPNLTDFELVQILKTANAYNFIQTL